MNIYVSVVHVMTVTWRMHMYVHFAKYFVITSAPETCFQPRRHYIPDSKVHGDNMGPTWGRQDPRGPHVGHQNLAIWDVPLHAVLRGALRLSLLRDNALRPLGGSQTTLIWCQTAEFYSTFIECCSDLLFIHVNAGDNCLNTDWEFVDVQTGSWSNLMMKRKPDAEIAVVFWKLCSVPKKKHSNGCPPQLWQKWNVYISLASWYIDLLNFTKYVFIIKNIKFIFDYS